MMTDATAATKIAAPFDIDFDASVERVRGLNENMVAAVKPTGAVSLDSYEQTVTTLLDLSQKAADSTKVDWVSALAKSQASIISEVTNTYTSAVRDLLK